MAKKPMTKTEEPTEVTIQEGPMAGMTFEPEDHTPADRNGQMKVKYKAPNNGPRAVVTLTRVRGGYRPADKRQAVHAAFSPLIPANIAWSADRGYSERTSGHPLSWNRSLSRFVPSKEESKVEELPKDHR